MHAPELRVFSSLHRPLAFIVLSAVVCWGFNSYENREKVRQKNGGRCSSCRRKEPGRMEASHIKHGRGKYDSTDNGEPLCPACHYIYHFRARENPRGIRLTVERNLQALYDTWDRMSRGERRRVAKQLGLNVSHCSPEAVHDELECRGLL